MPDSAPINKSKSSHFATHEVDENGLRVFFIGVESHRYGNHTNQAIFPTFLRRKVV
jgi:hypothetical protein